VINNDTYKPKAQIEKDILLCKKDLSHIPTLYSLWTIQYILFYLALILFKKNEDYIARYSQDQTLNLVSIYQRRIIDVEGNVENGIEKMFRNIVKSRKETKQL
jgi:hypothetical protein